MQLVLSLLLILFKTATCTTPTFNVQSDEGGVWIGHGIILVITTFFAGLLIKVYCTNYVLGEN